MLVGPGTSAAGSRLELPVWNGRTPSDPAIGTDVADVGPGGIPTAEVLVGAGTCPAAPELELPLWNGTTPSVVATLVTDVEDVGPNGATTSGWFAVPVVTDGADVVCPATPAKLAGDVGALADTGPEPSSVPAEPEA